MCGIFFPCSKVMRPHITQPLGDGAGAYHKRDLIETNPKGLWCALHPGVSKGSLLDILDSHLLSQRQCFLLWHMFALISLYQSLLPPLVKFCYILWGHISQFPT